MMGYLAISYISAVKPDKEERIHTFKVQKCASCFLIPMPLKMMPVSSARVVLRHIRRIVREWIPDVSVLGFIIAFHLP
jgi:hypothetical protein